MQATATAPLTDNDRGKIKGLIAQFDKDMLARRVPALVAIYTEDAILMPPHAPMVRGRAAIRKNSARLERERARPNRRIKHL